MKPNRQFERQCAVELVNLLVAHHALPLDVVAVFVAPWWKITFTFDPHPRAEHWNFRSKRYGKGIEPGIEADWLQHYGDVDEHQYNSDLISLFFHGWQVLREKLTGKATRPSVLLRRFQKQAKVILTSEPAQPAVQSPSDAQESI